MNRPQPGEYHPYYEGYINKVPDGNIIDILTAQFEDTQVIMAAVPEAKGNYRYADGKWSVKEVLIHIIDTERIMAYRALRIARFDKTDLPGYEQNDYVPVSDAEHRTIADLMEEFSAVRAATIAMFRHFTDEMYRQTGTANQTLVSVRALAFIIIGHELHHRSILQERYF